MEQECFACCNSFISPINTPHKLGFGHLCKLFRLPVSLVSSNKEITRAQTPVCDPCFSIINKAEELLLRIDKLESELSSVQEELKSVISNNFKEELDVEQANSYWIKKSLIQCWQGWSIPLSTETVHSGVKRKNSDASHEDAVADSPVESSTTFRSESIPRSHFQDLSEIHIKLEEAVEEPSSSQKKRKRKRKHESGGKTSQKCRGRSGNSISTETESLATVTNIFEDSADIETPAADTSPGRSSSNGKKGLDYKCSLCSKRFKDRSSQAIHVKRIHQGDPKPYECKICKWKFASPSKLFSHAQARDHPQEPEGTLANRTLAPRHPCPECRLMFKDPITLEGHIRGKHQGVDRPYACHLCPKTYKKKNHLDEHFRVLHTDTRPFVCHWCETQDDDEDDDDNDDLEAPRTSVATPKVSFSTQKKLDLHILTHHQNNTCSVCSKNFKTPYILSRHLASHGQHVPPSYMCEICGAKYTALKRLKVHQLRHENKEPYSCDLCDKVFSEARTLQHHRDSVHENKFKFHCQVCGIGCQQIYMLNRHMMCHSAEKKFSCSVCPLKFKRKQQLVIHERKHTGERPFKCLQCGKEFAEKKKLKNHEFVHGGEKPYQCPVCSKPFALKHYLTHHINSYHKNPKRKQQQQMMVEMQEQEEEEVSMVVVGEEGDQEDEATESIENRLAVIDNNHQQHVVVGSDFGPGELTILSDYDNQKFVSVELINEPHVGSEEVVSFDEGTASLEGELVVGEWIQFGFVSN